MVVIDEAQNLSDDSFESLRLLSNFEKPDSKLLHIVLAGQPALAEKLNSHKLAQLRQRLSVVVELAPFTLSQTADYINHRLKVAGYEAQPLFSYEALEFIAHTSEGIPRIINNLCFHSLSFGYSAKKRIIDLQIVHEAARSLELERGQYSAFGPVSTQQAAPVSNNKFPASLPAWSEPINNAAGFYPGPNYYPARKRFSVMKLGSAAFVCSILFLAVYLIFGARISPDRISSWFKTAVLEKSPAHTEDSLPKPDTRVGQSPATAPVAETTEPADPAQNMETTKPELPSSKVEETLEPVPDDSTPAKRPVSAKQRNSASRRKMKSDQYRTPNTQSTVQVSRTETLFQFALEKYGRADWTTVRKIRAMNPQIRDPYEVLHQGQTIRLPADSTIFD